MLVSDDVRGLTLLDLGFSPVAITKILSFHKQKYGAFEIVLKRDSFNFERVTTTRLGKVDWNKEGE